MPQSFLILGRGITGQAISDFLTKRNIKNYVIDDTRKPPSIDWKEYTHVVKSPGIPLHDPLVEKALSLNLPVWGDLAFFENPNKSITIGVTGTNGKSTVCAMIDHLLETAGIPHVLGGNFGTPVTDLPNLPQEGCFILELSSYQLETLPTTPVDFDIGILLNIDEDHLEHHKTMDIYANAKEQLLKTAGQRIVVTNDLWTREMAARYPCQTLSLEPGQHHWLAGNTLFHNNELHAELPTRTGQHDLINAAVTWIVGRLLKIDHTIILESLRSFKSLPHRQTHVRTLENVDFINDSKATNIHAVIPSLQRFNGKPIYLILGGVPKFENLDTLLPHMHDVVCVYGIGEASNLIEKCLRNRVPFKACQTLDTAIKTICHDLNFDSPAVVLLAPACSSFDQYKKL